jgi:Tfp pilus assembly protein PilN
MIDSGETLPRLPRRRSQRSGDRGELARRVLGVHALPRRRSRRLRSMWPIIIIVLVCVPLLALAWLRVRRR